MRAQNYLFAFTYILYFYFLIILLRLDFTRVPKVMGLGD